MTTAERKEPQPRKRQKRTGAMSLPAHLARFGAVMLETGHLSSWGIANVTLVRGDGARATEQLFVFVTAERDRVAAAQQVLGAAGLLCETPLREEGERPVSPSLAVHGLTVGLRRLSGNERASSESGGNLMRQRTDEKRQPVDSELLERPYDPPPLFIREEVDIGGDSHTLQAHAGPAQGWSLPYRTSGRAQYRSRVVRVAYPAPGGIVLRFCEPCKDRMFELPAARMREGCIALPSLCAECEAKLAQCGRLLLMGNVIQMRERS